MVTGRRKLLLCCALAAAITPVAAGQRRLVGQQRRDLLSEAFKAFDRNHDGTLGPAELARARAAMKRRGVSPGDLGFPDDVGAGLEEFDASGDGALDEAEARVAQGKAAAKGRGLTAEQEKLALKALRLYAVQEEARDFSRSVREGSTEAAIIAVLATLPTGLLLCPFFRLHETRGWRRPTWVMFGVVYAPVLALLLWVYFALLPDGW